MAKYEGYCELCDLEAGRIAIKNHIMKKHNEGKHECYLIRAESVWKSSPYWLLFCAPKTSTLDEVDDLLRDVWCECCGHMSGFFKGRYDEIDMDVRLSYFKVGDTFRYDYDFGTTTSLKLSIVDEMLSIEEKVQLLGRNDMPEYECTFCDNEADYIDCDWSSDAFACEKCHEEKEGDFDWLPTANSPRMGICGYEGEGMGMSLKFMDRADKSNKSVLGKNLLAEIEDADDLDDDELFQKFSQLLGDELGFDLMNMSDAQLVEFQNAFIEQIGLPTAEGLREADDLEMFLESCCEMIPMEEEEMQQLIALGELDKINGYRKFLNHTVEVLNDLTSDELEGYDFSELYASYELLNQHEHLFARGDER